MESGGMVINHKIGKLPDFARFKLLSSATQPD
jgi:hypothetical protein